MYERIPAVLTELLFPRRCPVCGDIVLPKGALICSDCIKKLEFVKQPVCKKCGKEICCGTAEYCLDCTKHSRSFEYGRALVNYNDAARESMVKIKYKGRREYLDFYADAICTRYRSILNRMEADALIPVPVHPSRKRQRGYNQAEVLAERIGRKAGLPVCRDALIRKRKTAPQKGLHPDERLKNLNQAFEAGNLPPEIESAILIDDIYTTGSTVEACAGVLKRAGVMRVYFITICIGRGQ